MGGDGSFRGARDLSQRGINCIGIPGTIDNDIACSEYTIGFDTAVNTCMQAVDRIRDTAQSHDRCSVVEAVSYTHLDVYKRQVLGCFGHAPGRVSLRINRAVLEEEGCPGAFLRGVFLACGALADPEKEYHLELYVPFYNLACDLQLLLAECSLAAKMIPRKGGYVLYFKESEAIEDFLTLTGAVQSAFSLSLIHI